MDETDLAEGLELLTELPEYDPSYELLCFFSWSGYEENSWTAVLRGPDGNVYTCEGGYCVMADDNTDRFVPEPHYGYLDELVDELRERYEEMYASETPDC